MQADSGFNNIVIILTYTILKSQAVEGEKVLSSVRLARDPHPSSLWLLRLLECCLCVFISTNFSFLPEGNRRERGARRLLFRITWRGCPCHFVTSSHIHWPALGHTWRQQIKSTDSGIRLLGSHPSSATLASYLTSPFPKL